VSVSVRIARDDDQRFVEALGLQTALQTVSSVRATSKEVADQAFRRLVSYCKERSGTVILIAERNTHRAGFLILLTDMPDDITHGPQAFVAYIAVSENDRGHGVGRALVQSAIAEGHRRNLPHISLMVSADNDAARALYESELFQAERILMCRSLGEGNPA